jgi:predicted ABC-type ATPase
VRYGGHDIPVDTIRARYPKTLRNLISLMPLVAQIQVFDNSRDAEAGAAIPDPLLVLDMAQGQLIWPTANDHVALRKTPVWARPLVEAALHTTRDAGPASKTRRKS